MWFSSANVRENSYGRCAENSCWNSHQWLFKNVDFMLYLLYFRYVFWGNSTKTLEIFKKIFIVVSWLNYKKVKKKGIHFHTTFHCIIRTRIKIKVSLKRWKILKFYLHEKNKTVPLILRSWINLSCTALIIRLKNLPYFITERSDFIILIKQ